MPLNRPALGDLFDMFDFDRALAYGRPRLHGGKRRRSAVEHIPNLLR